MKLNLKKDLCVLDIESTGINPSKDRIVQIAIIKHFADGRPTEEKMKLINPTIPISPEASRVNGITDEMVKNEPTFKQIAKAIYTFIGDADLCGYNSNRFDIPMLTEEFGRAGIQFSIDGRNIIDVFKIFTKMEPRTLKAAYRFYCKKEHIDAHNSLADAKVTFDVLLAQIEKYKGIDYNDDKGTDNSITKTPITNDVEALCKFSCESNWIDYEGKLIFNDEGVAVFSFGKHRGKSIVQICSSDKSYYDWIMRSEDFSTYTKLKLTQVVEGKLS